MAFLLNGVLRDQGLLSRILVSSPESLAGSRFYRERTPAEAAAITLKALDCSESSRPPPALREGKRNELDPLAVPLSPRVHPLWKRFYNHVEGRCADMGASWASYRTLRQRPLSRRQRIAGVLTMVETNLAAKEIGAEAMANAIELMNWYLGEADRLQQAGAVSTALQGADELWKWLHRRPEGRALFSEIMQLGPNQIRSKSAAENAERPRAVKAINGEA
jgi:hypothetical protein